MFFQAQPQQQFVSAHESQAECQKLDINLKTLSFTVHGPRERLQILLFLVGDEGGLHSASQVSLRSGLNIIG